METSKATVQAARSLRADYNLTKKPVRSLRARFVLVCCRL